MKFITGNVMGDEGSEINIISLLLRFSITQDDLSSG